MLHQEADGVTTFAATKTLVDLLSRRHSKRWGFFVVKRTLANVVYPTFFQAHKSSDYLYDIYPAEDLLYSLLADQFFTFAGKDRKLTFCSCSFQLPIILSILEM